MPKNFTELLTENPAQNNHIYNQLKIHNESNRDYFVNKHSIIKSLRSKG